MIHASGVIDSPTPATGLTGLGTLTAPPGVTRRLDNNVRLARWHQTQHPEALDRLYKIYCRGRMSEDDLARSEEIRAFSREYTRFFWNAHSKRVLSCARNLDAADLLVVAELAVVRSFMAYLSSRGRLFDFVVLSVFQACNDQVRTNYAASRRLKDRYEFVTVDLFGDPPENQTAVRNDLVDIYELERGGFSDLHVDYDRLAVQNAVGRLDPQKRRIVRLHMEGLSLSEIARTIDPISPPHKSTVMRYLDRAFRCLASIIDDPAMTDAV